MIRKGTHDILPVETVPLMPDAFNTTVMPYIVTLPPVEQVVARMDADGNSLLALFGPPARLKLLKLTLKDLSEDAAPYPGCQGILFNNRPVWGRDHLLADLYCGVGLFSVALSDRFMQIVGVEDDTNAMRDYRNNTTRDTHAKGKSTGIQGMVDKITKGWKYGETLDGKTMDWTGATVVVDPPRTGLGKHVTNDLIELKPQRIYYMSCDPATLARDLRALDGGGYTVRRARVFDMFPQTSHIETLVELIRD
jgi:tRNA (uracil-5-)-methyltransferase-like protein